MEERGIVANPVIIEVKANVTQAKTQINSLGQSFRALGSSVRSLVATSSQAMTGVRQMAQGVQNLGFVLSGLVGIPVAGALKGIANDAMSFERAMVEVQKTTGLASEQISVLSTDIRQLSLATPTSAVELAKLAGEAGRAGVGLGNILAGNVAAAREEILEFTRVVDMMQISTTLSGEEAAQAFGRFVTIFKDIDTSNIENLGSAINELGQSASVSEDEIVGAMMRIAPAAATLGMSAQDVAGMATAITQMSESMSRGGTRVRSALEQMTLNWESAAKLIGESTDSMVQRLNTDALGVFEDVVYAIANVKDNTEQLAIATEIFGNTGGNAVQRFAASWPELEKFLAISNKAFEEGTSLQIEFDRALGSTTEQLAILKNNLMEVGKTFMMELLPIAKELIMGLIPAIQELGQWVASLTTQQKLMAVGITALVVAGMPLLALIGSLGFGFSMILNGIVNVIGGLVGLAATILTLGSGVSVLSFALGGLAVLIGGVLLTKVAMATGAFETIMTRLREIADGAIDWGESFIAEIAEGIISGVAKFLISALQFVGNVISSFLEGHSPPKTGPLSTINQWGKRLMDTYLQSFMKADFGVLRDVTSVIKNVFDNMLALGKIREVDLAPLIDSVRTSVGELFSIFNTTGRIADEVLGKIQSALGEAGDEVVRLLRLQLQYNKALKDLDRANQKIADVEETYKAEVRAIMRRTDLTDAEKMRMIKLAKDRKGLAIDNANTEKNAAEKNVDNLKEQVDWQKQYIDSLGEQDSIWKDHLGVLEKLASAVGSAGRAIKGLAEKMADLLENLYSQLNANMALQKLYKGKGMDTTGLLREELSLRKRIVEALMRKGDLTDDEKAQLDANLDRIKELESILDRTSGTTIPTMDTSGQEEDAKNAAESLKTLTDSVTSLSEMASKGAKTWSLFKAAISGTTLEDMAFENIPKNVLDMLPDDDKKAILDGFKSTFSETQLMVVEWGNKIASVKDRVIGAWGSLVSAFQAAKTIFTGSLDSIKKSVQDANLSDQFVGAKDIIIPALLAIGGSILLLRGPFSFLGKWLNLGGVVSLFKSGVGEVAGGFLDIAKRAIGVGSDVKKASSKLLLFKNPLAALSLGITKLANTLFRFGVHGFSVFGLAASKAGQTVTGLTGTLMSASSKAVSPLVSIGHAIMRVGRGIGGFISKIPIVGSIFQGLGSAVSGGIAALASFGAQIAIIGGVVVAIAAVIAGVIDFMIRNWDRYKDIVLGAFENIKQGVQGFIDAFKSALGIGGESGKKFADYIALIRDAIEPIVKVISDLLVGAFYALSGVVKAVFPVIGKIIGTVFKAIGAFAYGLVQIVSGIIVVIDGIVDAITGKGTSKLVSGLGRIGEGFMAAFGGILMSVWAFVGGVWDAIKSIIKFFVDLYKQVVGNSIVPDLVNAVIGWFKKMIDFIRGVFSSVGKVIKPIVNYLRTAFKFISQAFKSGGAKSGFAAILKALGPLRKMLTPVVVLFYKLYSVVKPLISALSTGFKEGGIKGAFEALKSVLPTILPMIGGLLGSLITMMPKVLVGLGEFLVTKVLPVIWSFVVLAYEFLKANLPTWIGVLLEVLGKMAVALWGWISSTAIPWAIEMLGRIVEWIRANGPGILEALLGALVNGMGILWGWVTGTFLPWLFGAIGTAISWIWENGPAIIETLLSALIAGMTLLWGWITEYVIPWLTEFISGAATYIKENAPQWAATVIGILVDLAGKMLSWVRTDVLPLLGKLIQWGADKLKLIATAWFNPIKTGLEKIYGKFKDIFDSISEYVERSIKGAINSVIGAVEGGINKIIEGVNSMIRKVNAFAQALGFSAEIPEIYPVKFRRLAKGGIALREQLAIVGDKPEAIIPLDRLDGMINNMADTRNENKGDVTIIVKDNVVRKEEDLERIVTIVRRQLGLELNAKFDLGARGIGF